MPKYRFKVYSIPTNMVGTYQYFMDNSDFILDGFYMTLRIVIFALFFGFLLGVFAALAKLSRRKIIRYPTNFYVEVFRGTPLLLQIFVMAFSYPTILREVFGIEPELGTWTNPEIIWDVIIVLALNTGAYQAEIIRAGIESIPVGQMEAARSIGLTHLEALRFIILPQAFRVVMPPLANEFINLVLNTSLVATVAVRDLTYVYRILSARSFRTLELLFLIGTFYFVLTFILSRLFQYIERKYHIPGLGIDTV